MRAIGENAFHGVAAQQTRERNENIRGAMGARGVRERSRKRNV